MVADGWEKIKNSNKLLAGLVAEIHESVFLYMKSA